MTQEQLLNICDTECSRIFKMPEHEYTEEEQTAFYGGFYKGLKYMLENPPQEE